MPARKTETPPDKQERQLGELPMASGSDEPTAISDLPDAEQQEDVAVDLTPIVDSYQQRYREAREAFHAAQQLIGTSVTKNSKNEFFKGPGGKPSTFADLNAVLEAVVPPLLANNLSLRQNLRHAADRMFLETSVVHVNGVALDTSVYPIIAKDLTDPQKFGAGITYARRYSLMTYFNLGAEDDDGNTAAAPPKPAVSSVVQQLGTKLKAAGFTKETMPAEMERRFGDSKLTVGKLSDDQAQGWLDELGANADGIPF